MVYSRYSRSMLNTAYRIIGDRDEAEDVLQDSFISAFRSLKNYRGDATFGAWLKRIVINKAVTALQRKKTERLPDSESWDVPEIQTEEPDEWSVNVVRQAILNLPDGYRTVLSLYLLEGYDHEEIAGILGISVSTSKSQLNRAKARLRLDLKTLNELNS